MNSVLNQIKDRELVLLMYAADELSAADRAEVERLLGSDATMRKQLELLRASQDALDRAMMKIDAMDAVPGSRSAAGRQFGRAVQQWHIDRLARWRGDAKRAMRFQWWTYPLATAAAITVAVVVWWQTQQPVQLQDDPIAVGPGALDVRPDFATDLALEEPARYAVALESMVDESAASLPELERELQAVQSLREAPLQ